MAATRWLGRSLFLFALLAVCSSATTKRDLLSGVDDLTGLATGTKQIISRHSAKKNGLTTKKPHFFSGQALLAKGKPPQEMSMKFSLTPKQKQIQQRMAAGQKDSPNSGFADKNGKQLRPAVLKAGGAQQCSSYATRRPWSQTSSADRRAFLQAVACLATKPGTTTHDGYKAQNAHEDFVLLHWELSSLIHYSAYLLPCHRLIVRAWFSAIQSQCGYKGDLIYFDLNTYADANTIWSSPDIWSDQLYGPNSGTVTTGVQGKTNVHYTASTDTNSITVATRPLQRNLRTNSLQNIPFVNYMTSDYVRALLSMDDYDDFRQQFESSTHAFLHVAIGGDLLPSTSPNDFFFWSIHSAVDYIWAAWQVQNGGANLKKFDGFRDDYDESAGQAQVSDVCPMLGTWSSDSTVADLMDVHSPPNCYQYAFPSNINL